MFEAPFMCIAQLAKMKGSPFSKDRAINAERQGGAARRALTSWGHHIVRSTDV